jgi:hypothetical protein
MGRESGEETYNVVVECSYYLIERYISLQCSG